VGDTAYFTVPFAQRVTVGIQAFAKAFMVVPLFFIITYHILLLILLRILFLLLLITLCPHAGVRAGVVQTSNNMTERMSVEELQSKVKGFKYAPCALGLKFIQMSVTGAPRQGPPMKYRVCVPSPGRTACVSCVVCGVCVADGAWVACVTAVQRDRGGQCPGARGPLHASPPFQELARDVHSEG
jgi:hypothetical protein